MMRCHPRRVVICSLCVVFYAALLIVLKHSSYNLVPKEAELVDDSTFDAERSSSVLENDTPTESRPAILDTLSNYSTNSIWETGADKWNDRITAQIRFVPRSYTAESTPLKYIYVPGGVTDTPTGQEKFRADKCLVDRCYLTTSMSSEADVVLLQNNQAAENTPRAPGQISILWLLESPVNSMELDWLKAVNWTATYRADSTIVTPYEKFVPYLTPVRTTKNYAEGKTKMVAWFVSNCHSDNTRMEYAIKLRKYITVDIFGYCGSKQCPRDIGHKCDDMLKTNYKFYLAFENSNCEYYITEKLFWNALLNNVVPVVMGARISDYLHTAPPGSYIHVEDYKTPRHLATYLHALDKNDTLYNSYFQWKKTGEFINTKFWCRLCAMIHDPDKPSLWIDDVEKWWRGNGTCTRDRWDNPSDVIVSWSSEEDGI